ncbi:MAG: adenosylcobalamin-dependent ribonucleoside-diphosphate reductase [Candidatus Marinimicrobia bacterium]|nr:adenosylcobalamin-dependent ribonucleoside-diphosphate reductase [Candidatus Neomarinimicrobiota bacterium]
MSETIEFPFANEPTADVPVESPTKSTTEAPAKDSIKPEKLGANIETYYGTDDLARSVLQNKYLAPWETSPRDLWERMARAAAAIEKDVETWETKFFEILEDFRFVPGGRIMHGAGRDDIKTTLNNCYVVAVKEDSISAIYSAIIDEAKTYKYGGGCGHDLSVLRPKGAAIGGTGGESCGPTGFMNLFSENTNTIAQHGRRGANMQTIRVDHPDIDEFVNIKRDLNKVKYSNISVLLTHEFMEAVEKDTDFDLVWGGKTYRTVKARKLWDAIIESAHASAEPGLIFWDTMKEHHNAEYCSPLVSTNPCGEQPLPDGGCCNLGALNLARFVDTDGNFMMDTFKIAVNYGTRFLDNIIDINADRHALSEQKENALADRRIGLGILGLGDMLVARGIKYDTEEALAAVEEIMHVLRDTAYETSVELAEEKGAFPNFDWEGYRQSKFVKNLPKGLRETIKTKGIRNSTILTVAPTGSGAIVAQVTSGIEPIFATSYKRRVKKNEGYGDQFTEYKVVHPTIKKLFGDDIDLPPHVVTAHDIDPYFRVKMQGVIQKYIDASISSTVNLAEDVPVETVADIYMTAYKAGLKGITVYREGSRDGILISDKKSGTAKPTSPEPAVGNNGSQPNQQSTLPESAPQVNAAKAPLLRPRTRPRDTVGITRRLRTGEGSLYVTINHDENGLCEVFTTIGKAGGNAAAQAEAISRLISLALRSGIDVREIVKQLKGISGPNPVWEEGQLILSTPDAIGKALERHLNEFEKNATALDIKTEKAFHMAPEEDNQPQFDLVETTDHGNSKTMTTCPECGGNVFHESGCVTCPNCGYSKC